MRLRDYQRAACRGKTAWKGAPDECAARAAALAACAERLAETCRSGGDRATVAAELAEILRHAAFLASAAGLDLERAARAGLEENRAAGLAAPRPAAEQDADPETRRHTLAMRLTFYGVACFSWSLPVLLRAPIPRDPDVRLLSLWGIAVMASFFAAALPFAWLATRLDPRMKSAGLRVGLTGAAAPTALFFAGYAPAAWWQAWLASLAACSAGLGAGLVWWGRAVAKR